MDSIEPREKATAYPRSLDQVPLEKHELEAQQFALRAGLFLAALLGVVIWWSLRH